LTKKSASPKNKKNTDAKTPKNKRSLPKTREPQTINLG